MGREPIRFSAWRVAIGLLLVSAPVAAQSPAALEGRYVLVPEQSDDVRGAIDRATAEAGFFVRKVGRGVLRVMLEPAPRIEIRFDSVGVWVTAEDGRPLRTVVGGPPVQVRNARGERERVSTEWAGDSLVRWFDAGKAKRRYRYSVSGDSATLSVSVEVAGSMLPRPLSYRLTYRRSAGES